MSASDPETVEEAVRLLETDLKVRSGFLEGLTKEDDWSFVIKSHAFVEAAISHLLAEALSEPTLQAVFANAETANPKSGKVAFVKALDLLGKDARRFIQKLSELRNKLVHDVSQVDFAFLSYVDSLDAQQMFSFVEAFGYFASGEEFEQDGATIRVRDFMCSSPKRGIWYSVMALAAVIYVSKDLARLKRITRSLQQEVISSST